MSSILKTLAIVAVGLALGVGVTFFFLTKSADKIIARAVAAKKAEAASRLPEKPWDLWTIEMENLHNELKEENVRLKKWEETLNQRQTRMDLDQQELEKTRKQIESLRTEIDQRLIEVTEGEMGNLKRLAQSYASLTPRAAVAIFKEMDDSTLVKILSMMKTETVGTMLEEMSRQSVSDQSLAKRAALLSEKLRLVKPLKPAGSS